MHPSTHSFALKLVSITWIAIVASVASQNPGRYDETKWTRGTLASCTLEWPAANVAQLVRASEAWKSSSDAWLSSLGPRSRDDINQALLNLPRDAVAKNRGRNLHVTATEAIKCDVCNHLISKVWDSQVEHVHLHFYEKRKRMDATFVQKNPTDMLLSSCESATEDLVASLTIEKVFADVETSTARVKPMQLVLYTVQDRAIFEAPTDIEITATLKACSV